LKRILVYYPPNKRSVAIETLCRTIKEAGHEVIVLTLSERGSFHEALEKVGIETLSYVIPRKPSWKFFHKQITNLISVCKNRKIDFVWSHLQEASLSALMAQPFMKTKVVAFRHHAESAFYAEMGEKFAMVRNKNEVRLDKVINRLAKTIVIPSSGVWYSMEKYEGADMKKVKLLPYIYDFTTYQRPDYTAVEILRDRHSCRLMIIMVSRMVPSKQHMLVFETLKKLVNDGLSIKMIVMDDGPLRPQLETFITENNLSSYIIMTGFREDFVNYMAASDLLIHPSLTEASNNVVKELALMEKGVAVCKDVGDFNDYIEEGRNGFFLDRYKLGESIEKVIREAYANPEKLKKMGSELKKDVLHFFSDSQSNRQRFLKLLD
jgi:glycosyltransferase involved in cell wall biosynthesis